MATAKFDAALAAAWIEYYEANHAWDDLQTHGGDDFTPYKRKCERLYKKIEKSHGVKMADAMVKWAGDAYERMYYNRGLKKEALLKALPAKVDPTLLHETLGYRTPEQIEATKARRKLRERIGVQLSKLPASKLEFVLRKVTGMVEKQQAATAA